MRRSSSSTFGKALKPDSGFMTRDLSLRTNDDIDEIQEKRLSLGSIVEQRAGAKVCVPLKFGQTRSKLFVKTTSMEITEEKSNVYSRWRSIAHSSPELWTNLTIELPPALKTEADASKLEERITEWILRTSSNLSIDLQVNGPFFRHRQDRPADIQMDIYTKLCRTIITAARRFL
ncbi:hypothetical protein BT96DRAFT_939225 [Gymnopus androsaceus JB14]|uniref:Uncharacterized protein n=1 Tax=Gymnopus androsaceus JB14 TaxID=1447944 RepID=A0A6A4HSH5_9AGAR|nr:hypothetical protein BT96DRAFT_939225 [Gymnopus androsaceus JB14]